MKKYVFAAFALVIVVSLSAFNNSNNNSSYEDALFWYPVQSDGSIDHNALINPGSVPMTKTQLRNSSLVPCPEASGTHCIRGFEQEQDDDVATDVVIDFTEKAE